MVNKSTTSYGVVHTLQKLYAGQTLARIFMNRALAAESIEGRVVDLGGGRSPDYFSYLRIEEGATIEACDLSLGAIDFETDALPYPTSTIDTVLMCNILEHIYHYAHLLSEARRVMRPHGAIIGFVPFWVGYHPDPHDYFRYTQEALRKILAEAGFESVEVTPIGGGPFVANFNTVVLSFPRLLRPVLYVPYALVDRLFLFLRPNSRVRHPLGYLFTARAPQSLGR
jgi:SAM-dependent methyltransferase